MSEPTVCAVMLTANRPEMARRAVKAFEAQTYQKRRLLVFNTGPIIGVHDLPLVWELGFSVAAKWTIGQLRNEANSIVDTDILIHWDDDDYSHPNRIAEQVELLQSSGAQAVGYREMLFWREILAGQIINERSGPGKGERAWVDSGEAWLYSNGNPSYACGTSLAYWRKTWEAKPFPALNCGEDTEWLKGLKSVGVSGLNSGNPAVAFGQGGPAMIARIHAGNTSDAYRPELMRIAEKQGGEWRRVPAWDADCRAVME